MKRLPCEAPALTTLRVTVLNAHLGFVWAYSHSVDYIVQKIFFKNIAIEVG